VSVLVLLERCPGRSPEARRSAAAHPGPAVSASRRTRPAAATVVHGEPDQSQGSGRAACPAAGSRQGRPLHVCRAVEPQARAGSLSAARSC